MANYWEEEEKKRPKMDWRNAPDSGTAAGKKAISKNALAKKMAQKKFISEPNMKGFTDSWRKSYLKKMQSMQGGEPRLSTKQLSDAYMKEQRGKK